MTSAATADVQCTLTIPRYLAACFATPAELKVYLVQHRIWPERVQQERWRLGTETPGWIVDLQIAAPMPQSAGGTP